MVSLIAGLFFGSVSAYGAFRISNDPQDYWTSLSKYRNPPCFRNTEQMSAVNFIFHGFFCIVSAGILTVVMGMRFRKSGKLMPAGIMAGLR